MRYWRRPELQTREGGTGLPAPSRPEHARREMNDALFAPPNLGGNQFETRALHRAARARASLSYL